MLSTLKKYFNENSSLEILAPSFILLIFLISEFTSKSLKANYFEFNRISGVVKLFFEILVFIFLFKVKKPFIKRLLALFVFFTINYFIGQLLLQQNSFEKIILGFYTLNSYLFIFVLYYAFLPQKSKDGQPQIKILQQLRYLELTLKLIIILNSLAILCGLIYNINIFSTYYNSERFGYNGLFLHASHSSYIYCIWIIYFFNKYHINRNKTDLMFLIILVLQSILIGTKTIYLFILLTTPVILGYYFKKKFVIGLLVFIGLMVVVFQQSIFQFLKNTFNLMYNFYVENGFFTTLTSTRNLSIENEFLPYITDHWSPMNYVFGGADFLSVRSELSLIDFYWFFGIIGTFVYLSSLKKIFKNIFRNDNNYLIYPFIILFVAVFFAGSFFSNPPIMPYLIILIFTINFQKSLYFNE